MHTNEVQFGFHRISLQGNYADACSAANSPGVHVQAENREKREGVLNAWRPPAVPWSFISCVQRNVQVDSFLLGHMSMALEAWPPWPHGHEAKDRGSLQDKRDETEPCHRRFKRRPRLALHAVPQVVT